MENMNLSKHKEPVSLKKTRKALDWALSCLIRLPVTILFVGVILAAVGFISLIFAPENVLNALRLMGVIV